MARTWVPPAPKLLRQVTEHIKTVQGMRYASKVCAVFIHTAYYDDPDDAPAYARMQYKRAVRHLPARWHGEIMLQFFADREEDALAGLLDGIVAMRAPVPAEELALAKEIHAGLVVSRAIEQRSMTIEEWQRSPFPRPRPPRTQWTDENGKVHNMYLTTEGGPRAHLDPDCKCKLCNLTTPLPPDPEEEPE